VCSNSGLLSLGGTPSGGTWTGTGVSGSAGNFKFNPAAGTQTLVYTASNGACSNSGTTTITVNPAPNATIVAIPPSLCSGAAGNTASVAPGATSYLWTISNGTITSGKTGNNIVYTANMYDNDGDVEPDHDSDDSVKLSVTVTNGCGTASSTVRILINQLPTVANISGNNSVIKGSSVTLTDATTGGFWSSSNTAVATVSSGVVKGISAGSATISYKVTNAVTGCSNNATKTINVYNPLTATASTGTILCNGSTTTITVNAIGGSGGYNFSLNGGKFQNSNKFTVGAGTYSITVTDNIGDKVVLTGISISQPAAVVLKLVSETNASSKTAANGSFTVNATGGTPGYTYSDNGGSSYQSSPTFSKLAPKTYTVYVKDANGCTAKLSVTVGAGSNLSLSVGAITQLTDEQQLDAKVAPNPSATKFTVILNGNSNKPVEMRVIDMYGRSVYQARGSASQSYEFGERFTGGVYIVQILQGELVKTLKVVKAK